MNRSKTGVLGYYLGLGGFTWDIMGIYSQQILWVCLKMGKTSAWTNFGVAPVYIEQFLGLVGWLVGCLVFRSTSQIQHLFLGPALSLIVKVSNSWVNPKWFCFKRPFFSSNQTSTHPTPRDRWHFRQISAGSQRKGGGRCGCTAGELRGFGSSGLAQIPEAIGRITVGRVHGHHRGWDRTGWDGIFGGLTVYQTEKKKSDAKLDVFFADGWITRGGWNWTGGSHILCVKNLTSKSTTLGSSSETIASSLFAVQVFCMWTQNLKHQQHKIDEIETWIKRTLMSHILSDAAKSFLQTMACLLR